MTDNPVVTQAELNAYVDGLLSHRDVPRVEAWLADHPEDAAAVHAYRLQNSQLLDAFNFVLEEEVPSKLEAVVTGGVFRETSRNSSWMKFAASVLMVMAGAIGGWLLHGWQNGADSDPKKVFVQQAMGAHRVFVAEVRHPVEVPSSQEAHLVAWLSKRLGTPLLAPDISGSGFSLVGGRLLANGAKPAAQFMYENREGQRLTVYVRGASETKDTAFRFASDSGNSAFYWIDSEFAYALVAPMNREKLMPIVNKIYRELE